MEESYRVQKIEAIKKIRVQVPGSKSITNRALLLAALSDKRCTLRGVLFSDDSRGFLDCLVRLGFDVEIREQEREVTIQGAGGKIPNSGMSGGAESVIDVRSAGTAARFLTVMLAFAGGDYELTASPQMCRRPMQPLLDLLEQAGAAITYRGEKGHFPFHLSSDGMHMEEVSIDTGISSQFASALMMSGAILKKGLKVRLLGDRIEGAYIKLTFNIMKQFGIPIRREEDSYFIPPVKGFGVEEYLIEPDVSGACYFYAMAPLLKTNVIVKGVHMDCLQGDIKFLEALRNMGCDLKDGNEGVVVDGSSLESYPGTALSMKDFSDQTMTMAALAPFAETPTLIKNIGHIRMQESDRLKAILTELKRMGISCEEVPEEHGLIIYPGKVKETEVETYEDHRMAMAFTLIGLRAGGITIKNPGCCKKTFENYFQLIDDLTAESKKGC
ncbi:MAG: 3-phosphoshikimate 1-carboxyvinyltransferase [Lachnospiraceae bacterium]|nr:3-phosphoshikimate 1-carboxyvinyltransferase [Lachnospiraceae bacterium]